MNAPENRRRFVTSRKLRSKAKRRRSKAFIAEVRRQCRLANASDRRDDWRKYLRVPISLEA